MSSYLGIQAWLQSKGTVLWGGYWDVTDKHERPEAAAWFQQQIEEYEEWRADSERHERIVTAGTALNNLALDSELGRSIWGTTDGTVLAAENRISEAVHRLARSDPSTLQPAPPNGIIDPGDPQGHQHPEGSPGSGDSEHPGGDERNYERDRSLPSHRFHDCRDPFNCPWHGINNQ